ncbi:phospholipase [bacterium]|nr:phospholipase [bacterium]
MTSVYIIIGWLSFVALFQDLKPLQPGVNYQSEAYFIADSSMEFLFDLTYADSSGEIQHQQEIFDTLFAYIESAQKYILIDMFLFNSYKGPSNYLYKGLSLNLSRKLIQKKQEIPDIRIDFITDPVNTLYGGVNHAELDSMKQAGINTIVTDLTKLRDSNPLYSPLWRTFFQWFGNTSNYGFLPNAFDKDSPAVTLRSYLGFLNLKANHRKVFVADHRDKMVSIITSANPHSASSDFSNIGILVKGEIWRDIYTTEKHLAEFSNSELSHTRMLESVSPDQVLEAQNSIQLITEKRIRDALIQHIGSTTQGDTIKIAMFYLANRKIVKTILKASSNGASIQLILDPNKDGFGFHHNGTPNRPVVKELLRKSKGAIRMRWFYTHGEQYHTKMTLVKKQQGTTTVIMGSSNMTRKNNNNYNLETNVLLTLDPASEIALEIENYFDALWLNQGANYTTDYTTFGDAGIAKTMLYRFQEFSGLSTY